MPLPPPTSRRDIHRRVIDMQAYAREDGLYDVEAHLVDTKPFLFESLGRPLPVPPGQALHDLWVRLTVDGDFVVRDICAASDNHPLRRLQGGRDHLARPDRGTPRPRLVGSRQAAFAWRRQLHAPDGGADSTRHHRDAGHSRLAARQRAEAQWRRTSAPARQLLCLPSQPRDSAAVLAGVLRRA